MMLRRLPPEESLHIGTSEQLSAWTAESSEHHGRTELEGRHGRAEPPVQHGRARQFRRYNRRRTTNVKSEAPNATA